MKELNDAEKVRRCDPPCFCHLTEFTVFQMQRRFLDCTLSSFIANIQLMDTVQV